MAEYSGQSTNFLSKTFEVLDDALSSFAQNFSSNIAAEIAPLVMGGITLSFILLGIMAIRGMLDRPFTEVATKMMWASIITSIALTSAVYQSYIIDVFLTMPDDLIVSLSGAVNNTSVESGQTAAGTIEDLFSLGAYNAGLYFNEASMNPIDANLAPYLYGALVLLGTILCVVMGALWLIIAKVVLALMLGVGPIFICCLIWPSIRQYFFSWVGQILNTILTVIFVLAVFSIFAGIFEAGLTALVVDEGEQQLMNASVYTFLGVLCMGVLIVIPQYVQQLAGAAGGAVGTAMAKVSGGSASAGSKSTSGGAGAVRTGIAGKSAAGAYQKSRSEGAGAFKAARGARHEFNKSKQEMKQGYPDYFRKGTR
ncbi:type IV secretion system protein [Psychrobacter submarinus]|uniref:type IV secretion system protein n=2 Tax=Psychrobacter TaxID=497 RepID=UPI001917EFF4|nr:type IV secretion system protein [Psychrobacter submarinus]